MATITTADTTEQTQVERTDFPQAGVWFHRIFAILSAWLIGGLFLDGWAHFHGLVDNTFFTPWHAVFYSGFGVVGGYLLVNQVRYMRNGYNWRRALPVGY